MKIFYPLISSVNYLLYIVECISDIIKNLVKWYLEYTNKKEKDNRKIKSAIQSSCYKVNR